jgi:hypothetical protein
MPLARVINSRNLVSATETLPAQFRPSNQLRLEHSRATNPAFHAGSSFRPGLAEYRDGNGCGDLGLGWSVARAANRRRQRTGLADDGIFCAPAWARGDTPGDNVLPTSDAQPVATQGYDRMYANSAEPANVSGLGALGVLPDQLTSALGDLGELAVAPLGIAALALCAAYVLAKNKPRRARA